MGFAEFKGSPLPPAMFCCVTAQPESGNTTPCLAGCPAGFEEPTRAERGHRFAGLLSPSPTLGRRVRSSALSRGSTVRGCNRLSVLLLVPLSPLPTREEPGPSAGISPPHREALPARRPPPTEQKGRLHGGSRAPGCARPAPLRAPLRSPPQCRAAAAAAAR